MIQHNIQTSMEKRIISFKVNNCHKEMWFLDMIKMIVQLGTKKKQSSRNTLNVIFHKIYLHFKTILSIYIYKKDFFVPTTSKENTTLN